MKCLCGCGKEVKKGNNYIYGHNRRGKILSEEHKRKLSESHKGKPVAPHSEETKKILRDGKNSFLKIPVDNNILCEYGCGQPAKYIINPINQKFCCSKYYSKCSFMVAINKKTSGKANREKSKCEIHSDLMKLENPMFIEEHKEKVIKITTSSIYKEKMSKKLERLWEDDIFRNKVIQGRIRSGSKIPDEELSEFRRYYNKVYHYTRKSVKEYKNIINPDNKAIGLKRGLYNIDHIYSIFDGFNNEIEPQIMGSYINLQVLPWIVNLKKQRKSWISKEILLEKYKEII